MKKIYEAVVLHEGWEMDNLLWVVENDDGRRELRTTSHGSEYIMDTKEIMEKIAETKKSLAGLIEAQRIYLIRPVIEE